MKTLAILAVIALAGCTSAADEAEKRYTALATVGGDNNALCAAAGEVALAAQMEGDSSRAEHFSLMRDSHCASAQLCSVIIGGC